MSETRLIDKLMQRFDRIESEQANIRKSFETSQQQLLERRPGEVAGQAIIDKAFNPMRASGAPQVLGHWAGSNTVNLIDLGDSYKVPSGGRSKSLGYEDVWRAMYAGHDNACAKRVGWTSNDPKPEDYIVNKGFRRPNARWGKQKASLAEGQGATGGYAVPTQFYADLLRLMAEKAFVRDRCTVLPMQSRNMLVPALKQSSTTFSRGQSQFFGGVVMSWTPEANVIAESDPVFRQIELVARDLTFVTVASNQLLQDNAVALDTLLTTIFQEACAWSYDYYILQGKLANEPVGVINAPGSYSNNRGTASHVYLGDIANMLAHLYTQSWDNACWIANPSIIPELMQMTTVAQANQWLTWLNPAPNAEGGPLAQKIPAMLAGLPIFWSEKASYLGTKGDLILADFSKYLVGDRLAIQVEVSPHVRFPQNEMMWRVIVRWDGTPWQDSPITLADQTWQVSPMVVLN